VEKARLAATKVPETSELAAAAAAVSGQALPRAASLQELLRRPHVHHTCVCSLRDRPCAHALLACCSPLFKHPLRPVFPALSCRLLAQHGFGPEAGAGLSPAEAEAAEIDIKYEGFIARQVWAVWSVGCIDWVLQSSMAAYTIGKPGRGNSAPGSTLCCYYAPNDDSQAKKSEAVKVSASEPC
jgi:hypothetical protein